MAILLSPLQSGRGNAQVKEIESLIQKAIDAKKTPGAAWAVGRGDKFVTGSLGRFTYAEDSEKVTDQTLYDLASLTKVICTTSCALVLNQRGELDLEAHANSYLAKFQHDSVTVRDLLLHRSGLPAYFNFQSKCTSPLESEEAFWQIGLRTAIPPKTEYSCLGFMTMQRIIESIAGKTLDDFAAKEVFAPLGMTSTLYTPGLEDRRKCAPTEAVADWRRKLEDSWGFVRTREDFIQGSVHDPAAFMRGGVSGNAGLFSHVADLALWAREFALGGEKLFDAAKVIEWTKRAGEASTRALGFDTKSPEGSSAGRRFHQTSFGHTGYTGTTVWIDPASKIYAVLLTNRVHPDDKASLVGVRPQFHDLAWEFAQEL